MPASEQAYTNASSRSANSSSETFGSWSIARISAASSALSGIISSSAGAAAAARGSAAAIATSFIREAMLLTRADDDDTELDHFARLVAVRLRGRPFHVGHRSARHRERRTFVFITEAGHVDRGVLRDGLPADVRVRPSHRRQRLVERYGPDTIISALDAEAVAVQHRRVRSVLRGEIAGVDLQGAVAGAHHVVPVRVFVRH